MECGAWSGAHARSGGRDHKILFAKKQSLIQKLPQLICGSLFVCIIVENDFFQFIHLVEIQPHAATIGA